MHTPPPFADLTLGAALARLPAHCALHARAESDQLDPDETRVLWIEGDLELQQLDADAPWAALATLFGLPEPDDDEWPWSVLVVAGALRLAGPFAALDEGPGVDIVVQGDLHARQLVPGSGVLYVGGSLRVEGLLWCDGQRLALEVDGDVEAAVALFTGGCAPRIGGEGRWRWCFEEGDAHGAEALGLVLQPAMIDAFDDGRAGAAYLIDREALVRAARAGEPLLQDLSQALASMPLSATPADDEPITAEAIAALAGDPALIDDSAADVAPLWHFATGWRVLPARVGAAGRQQHAQVSIEVAQAWRFSLAVVPGTTAGGGTGALGLLRRSAQRLLGGGSDGLGEAVPPPPVLSLHCSRFDDEDGWGDFEPLDEQVHDGEAWAACEQAWRCVLAHAREARGQAAAGWPLRARLLREMTPQALAALCALPFVREQAEDDEGGEPEALSLGELFVVLHPDTASLVLSWCIDPDDDDEANHCAVRVEPAPEGGLRILQKQRRDDDWAPLVPQAVALHAALLRRWRGLVPRLQQLNAAFEAEREQARWIDDTVRLRREPPYADDLPDAQVFSAELLDASAQWRRDGRAWVDTVRTYRRRAATGELSAAERRADLPEDPRRRHGALALRLAQEVNRRADAGLHARLARLFPFSPDALGASFAHEQGQFIGPVFWLGAGRALAGVGAPYDEERCWIAVDTSAGCPTAAEIPGLHGLGRSADRRCWARSDGDGVATARDRWDGPVLARFPLPDGTEGLPPALGLQPSARAERCDELIPFNDGQRVLLRNPTGIYLLNAGAARAERLHPRDVDPAEDGPYTWPKNRDEDDDDGPALSLDMLHMALSPCERFVALGDQDSDHILLDVRTGAVLARCDPTASYPHLAAFTPDGSAVFFNSCHLYEGITQRVELAQPEAPPLALPWNWRLYAGTAAGDGHTVVGSAYGYLHALDASGARHWDHHVGSSLSGLDAAPDGSEILAGSYGGYLVRLVRQPGGEPDPHRAGDSPYAEVQRWLFPRGGDPLSW